MKNICVFCGSSAGVLPAYAAAARRMGQLIAQRGMGLVYGGGDVGLMGETAKGALGEKGSVTGVIPASLVDKEIRQNLLTELLIVDNMHQRKAKMADLSDAFVTLPGGLGTLEEFFEVLSWAQLGLHKKPCALLNVEGYYNGLIDFLNHAVEHKFVSPAHRQLVLVEKTPEALLDAIATFQPPAVDLWIKRGDI
ncbi:MAG: TIGR00730 family Rossman fold protein [Nitrospinae bacterium]|nr:TIGR00730 family Rossman fold protein [Nitrospinota bacterium]